MDIAVIGSGHVAWHYARFFRDHGHRISQVYNRTAESGKHLATEVSARYISSLDALSPDVQLIIIAVQDQAIPDIVQQMSSTQAIVVHTAGATSADVLKKFKRYGVIYPPQSLHKSVETFPNQIPFAIEGSSDEVLAVLLPLVQHIAPTAFVCSSEQRLALHVAAVFANNFPNALYQIAYTILKQQGLSFDLLKPLILETAQKVQGSIPADVQTGPAQRNDEDTIQRHLDFLGQDEEFSKIYQQLTSWIIKSKSKG